MKGVESMRYFTKEEARRALDNSSLALVAGTKSDPNAEAFQVALEQSSKSKHSGWDVMTGFNVGFAAGKHYERARCAEHWQNMTPIKREMLAEALALLEASSEEIVYMTVNYLKLVQ